MDKGVVSRRTLLIATGSAVAASQFAGAAAGISTLAGPGQGFAHPGLLHTATDLARMRTAVAARQSPIHDGFLALAAHARSSYDYPIRNLGQITSWGRGPANFMNEAVSDSGAAYQNALMWSVTGEVRYADKARDILNVWSASLEAITGADGQLGSGLQGFKFVNAAELLRHSGYTGWAPADVARCVESFRAVWYRSFSGTALFANGNWDVAALQAILAIAVFCDDRVMFDDAVRYAVAGAGNGRIEHIIVEASGQGQESGRSQAYAQLALGLLVNTAAVAWNQGVDLFGYAGDRILRGFEYTARYNLGDDGVPFVPDLDRTGKYLKKTIAAGNRGQFQPIYELAYAHYSSRRGLSTPYLQAVVFRGGARVVEGGSDDHPGWGTLTHAQPPITEAAPASPPGRPSGLTARSSAHGVELTWTRSVEPTSCSNATSYTVKRAATVAGPFQPVASKVTTTGYTDLTARKGQTYCYTVSASNAVGDSADALPVRHTVALPLPWATKDVGPTNRAGSTGFDGETFVLEAGGTDIGGVADSLRFVWLPMSGDGAVTARVVHPISSQYASVGVMMRQSLAANSAHASMLIKGLPLHTWSGVWTVRPSTGAPSTGIGSTPVPPSQQVAITTNAGFPISNLGTLPQSATPLTTPYVEAASDGYRLRRPYWVRVVRKGDRFTGLISPDGTTWTEVGSSKLRLGNQLLVGITACSALGVEESYAETTTAAFDNVSAPGWPVQRPAVPAGELTARTGTSAVELAWTDSASSASYTVHRSTAGGGRYEMIAEAVEPVGFGVETRYRDASGVPGTTYHYVVTKTSVTGAGPRSNEAAARMPTPPAPVITSAATAFANVGRPFQYRIAATNDPAAFSATGLPPGLLVDARTGMMAGTPSRQGEFTIEVKAANAAGAVTSRLELAIAAPPPGRWAYRDIGDYSPDERDLGTFSSVAIRTRGITSYHDGSFIVRGAGSDLNVINQGMTAQYASVPVIGDRTITARIASSQPGRVGLIMAKSLSPFDQLAGAVLTGDRSQFVRRLRVATGLVTTERVGTPTWLRLTRTGEVFVAEISDDGETWTMLGEPATVPGFGDASYHAGLAVVSRSPFVLNTTVFDHVSIS